MTIFLADTLETIGKLSKANERNDAKHRPVLKETFAKQKDLSLQVHLANMKQWEDDEYQCYKFSDKLKGEKMDYINCWSRSMRIRWLDTDAPDQLN
jgi:hypothetical protein